jgi:transcriptional regulator PpsR
VNSRDFASNHNNELVQPMNREATAADQVPFSDAEALFDGFIPSDIAQLAYCAGDFVLAIDGDHIVRDVAVNVHDISFAQQWIGQRWSDTVTADSRDKVEQLLAGEGAQWRQVNHGDGEEMIAVRYRLIRPHGGRWSFAIGRDMRQLAAIQQRLIKAQQAMERDYLKLRQTEARYRLLFDAIKYPVLLVEAATMQVHQVNDAARQLLGKGHGAIEGRVLGSLFAPEARDAIAVYLGALSINPSAPPLSAPLPAGAGSVPLTASAFRQSGELFWLVSLDQATAPPASVSDVPRNLGEIVAVMPDAFVLTDDQLQIIVANQAFIDLVHATSAEQLVGMALGGLIGRADVDLPLLRKQLRDHQQVRNYATLVSDLAGGEEPVELSATMVDRGDPVFGFILRQVARRERALERPATDFPQSVDQLTELVGRRTLKQIVRESTDLIERMCIEAALTHTSDNRASAAEILGISRQSLYSKLHQHGIGNFDDRD